MAFLGGLSLLGSSMESYQDLKDKQAIAQAHIAQAQKQQQSDALSQLMTLFQPPGGGMGAIPDLSGGTPPAATGSPQGAQTGAAAVPSPTAQAPPSGAQPGAAAPPVPEAPASTPPAAAVSGTPTPAAPPPTPPVAQLAQTGQNTTSVSQGSVPIPADLRAPQQNGAPSFADRFGASQGQPQGAMVNARPTPTTREPPSPYGPGAPPLGGQGQPQQGKLYNKASEKDQQQFQPQGQQTAQADPIVQKLQEAAQRGDQRAAQTLADPQKLQALRAAVPKYMELQQKFQRWRASQDMQKKRYDASQRHEQRMEHEFDVRDQERQDALKIKQDKAQEEKDEVKTLAGGLTKTGGKYRTSIKDMPPGIRAKVQAEALRQGIDFRQAEEEQRAKDSYDATVGRVGATIGQRVDFSARELSEAIPQVRETSAALPRGEFIPYNQIKQYFGKAVGDERLNDHIIALQTARNAYGRAMNPMGVPRVTENAQLRFDNIMTSAVGPKALEVQLERLWKEAQQMQRAAAALVPGSTKFGQPISDPNEMYTDPNKPLNITVHPAGGAEGGGEAVPPASMLEEGVKTTFKGGKGTWMLKNGKPVRVDQ